VKLISVLIIIVLIGFGLGVVSFDADRPLIEDAVLIREDDNKSIQIDFSAPVRIVGVFPEKSGDIVQIKLRVIALGEFDENLSILEKFVGEEEGKEVHISHMRYEGDVPGGPFIVMKFNQQVQWKVTEGDSLLGMNIEIKES
jgi:hypothetical protein